MELARSSVVTTKRNANCAKRCSRARLYTHFSFSLASGSKNLTATRRLPTLIVVPYSGIPSASATYTCTDTNKRVQSLFDVSPRGQFTKSEETLVWLKLEKILLINQEAEVVFICHLMVRFFHLMVRSFSYWTYMHAYVTLLWYLTMLNTLLSCIC